MRYVSFDNESIIYPNLEILHDLIRNILCEFLSFDYSSRNMRFVIISENLVEQPNFAFNVKYET